MSLNYKESTFRYELYEEFLKQDLLNAGHLFRVVRNYKNSAIPDNESFVTGDVVEAFISDFDYPVIEYAGVNQPGAALKPVTPEARKLADENELLRQQVEALQAQLAAGPVKLVEEPQDPSVVPVEAEAPKRKRSKKEPE